MRSGEEGRSRSLPVRWSVTATSAGGTDVDGLFHAIEAYLAAETAHVERLGALGVPPWSAFLAEGQSAGFTRVREYLATHDLRR
jgi:hypothetical protein